MAGKPGSEEEHDAALAWAAKHVRSGDSFLVKKMKAYLPDDRDPPYDEGTEQ